MSANFLSAASVVLCSLSFLDLTVAQRNHFGDKTHPANFVPTAPERACNCGGGPRRRALRSACGVAGGVPVCVSQLTYL